jgi:hypothetical protein
MQQNYKAKGQHFVRRSKPRASTVVSASASKVSLVSFGCLLLKLDREITEACSTLALDLNLSELLKNDKFFGICGGPHYLLTLSWQALRAPSGDYPKWLTLFLFWKLRRS